MKCSGLRRATFRHHATLLGGPGPLAHIMGVVAEHTLKFAASRLGVAADVVVEGGKRRRLERNGASGLDVVLVGVNHDECQGTDLGHAVSEEDVDDTGPDRLGVDEAVDPGVERDDKESAEAKEDDGEKSGSCP